MDSLPSEVWLHLIMERLPVLALLETVPRVCRRWRDQVAKSKPRARVLLAWALRLVSDSSKASDAVRSERVNNICRLLDIVDPPRLRLARGQRDELVRREAVELRGLSASSSHLDALTVPGGARAVRAEGIAAAPVDVSACLSAIGQVWYSLELHKGRASSLALGRRLLEIGGLRVAVERIDHDVFAVREMAVWTLTNAVILPEAALQFAPLLGRLVGLLSITDGTLLQRRDLFRVVAWTIGNIMHRPFCFAWFVEHPSELQALVRHAAGDLEPPSGDLRLREESDALKQTARAIYNFLDGHLSKQARVATHDESCRRAHLVLAQISDAQLVGLLAQCCSLTPPPKENPGVTGAVLKRLAGLLPVLFAERIMANAALWRAFRSVVSQSCEPVDALMTDFSLGATVTKLLARCAKRATLESAGAAAAALFSPERTELLLEVLAARASGVWAAHKPASSAYPVSVLVATYSTNIYALARARFLRFHRPAGVVPLVPVDSGWTPPGHLAWSVLIDNHVTFICATGNASFLEQQVSASRCPAAELATGLEPVERHVPPVPGAAKAFAADSRPATLDTARVPELLRGLDLSCLALATSTARAVTLAPSSLAAVWARFGPALLDGALELVRSEPWRSGDAAKALGAFLDVAAQLPATEARVAEWRSANAGCAMS